MRLLPLALALALALLAPAHAEPRPSSKAQDLRRLLLLSGSAQLGEQVVAELVASLRKAMPNVPESFWASFRSEVRTDELLDLIVPVYDRHLSADEVKALLAFYDSPAGKKFIAALPALTKESSAVGERWGRSLTERAIAKLKAEAAKQERPGK